MSSPIEGEESPEIEELEQESKEPHPVKTLRRLYLTIVNPLKAMGYVSYDPDLLIIPVMFILYAIFSFLQPFVVMSKIDIPSDLLLSMPDMTVGSFKGDFQRYYWGVSLTSFLLSASLGVIILLAISKLMLGDIQYKTILSGSLYSAIVFVVLGLVWLALILLIPAVAIPYRVQENKTYIEWPNGTMEISQPTFVFVRANMTNPANSGDSAAKSLNWRITSSLMEMNTTLTSFHSLGGISLMDGAASIQLTNGSTTNLQVGVPVKNLDLTAEYLFQEGKHYLSWPDGSRIEVRANTAVIVTLNITIPDAHWGDNILLSWHEGNLTIAQPTSILVVSNITIPPDVQNNETYIHWIVSSEFIRSDLVAAEINVTVPSPDQKDKGSLQWHADSVLAQAQSLTIYFNQVYSSQTPELIGFLAGVVLPLLARIWQSIILLVMIKKSHDVSWTKAGLAILIQQGVLLVLRF